MKEHTPTERWCCDDWVGLASNGGHDHWIVCSCGWDNRRQGYRSKLQPRLEWETHVKEAAMPR